VAVGLGAVLLFRDGGPGAVLPGQASSKPVKLVGLAGSDPFGDNGQEHDEDAHLATDGVKATDWSTEHYSDFTKAGVGLVLKAPRPVALSRITLLAGGGFQAKIQASDTSSGEFTDVAGWKEVGSQSTFKVDTNGKDYRYYLVWLKLPRSGGRATIYEVTART
jgi:hypothetical protein